MKNHLNRLLSALLLVCMLFSVVSCSGNIPEETSAQITDSITEAPPQEITFNLTADYLLVRPDDTDPTEVLALQLLSRGIQSACGIRCSMLTDFAKPGDEIKPNEYEILVGKTNRAESAAISEGLAYYEWNYKVFSENVIAICGGSPEATLNAVRAFLKDIVGYEEDDEQNVISAGSAAAIKAPTERSYIHDYPVKTLRIGARDITEYSVVASSADANGVETVINGISRLCGKNLPVVTFENYKSGPAIFIGCGKPDGSHYEASVYGNNRYYITESDGNFFIDFKLKTVGEEAAKRFVAEFLPKDAIGELTVTLDEGEVITGMHLSNGTNKLVLEKSSSTQIADGMIYTEELYYDPEGAPVRAYLLTVKNGAAKIETSMPSDSAEAIKTVSNIKNQLSAAEANGKNVIAGINADFFDMGGTNIMTGLCIKDGKLIHSVNDRPWFGITEDGKPVMGTADEYDSYVGKLTAAVGGSHIILKNDAAKDIAVGTEFADTRHPRTAVGVTPDGDIVLLVVDGRQPEISNGASLADLAFILASFGCSDGINLDGGGSSTLILKDSSGSFTTKNSPSAGSLRSVANGLMVILP